MRKLIFITTVYLLLLAGCQPTNTSVEFIKTEPLEISTEFAVYLAKAEKNTGKFGLDQMILEDEPLFTLEDIESYYWNDQRIVLKDSFVGDTMAIIKELNYHDQVTYRGGSYILDVANGDQFVMIVNDQRILKGSIGYEGLSSGKPFSREGIRMVDMDYGVEIINLGTEFNQSDLLYEVLQSNHLNELSAYKQVVVDDTYYYRANDIFMDDFEEIEAAFYGVDTFNDTYWVDYLYAVIGGFYVEEGNLCFPVHTRVEGQLFEGRIVGTPVDEANYAYVFDQGGPDYETQEMVNLVIEAFIKQYLEVELFGYTNFVVEGYKFGQVPNTKDYRIGIDYKIDGNGLSDQLIVSKLLVRKEEGSTYYHGTLNIDYLVNDEGSQMVFYTPKATISYEISH